MECRHPANVAGKCLDCGALVEAEKAAMQAPVPQDGGTPVTAAGAATAAEKQPAAAKETAKKAAQKQK